MTNPTNLIDELRDLLSTSVREVLATMFSTDAHSALAEDVCLGDESVVAGSVGFIGDVNGTVYIMVPESFARSLARQMLGLSEAELDGDEMVNDVIGELSNMVVGGVKSQLCDRGLSCVLTIPSVVRGQSLSAEPVKSIERRRLGFHCGAGHAIVELQFKTSH